MSSLVQLSVLPHDIGGDPITVKPSSLNNGQLAFKPVPEFRKVPLGNQQRFGNNADQRWFCDRGLSPHKFPPMLDVHQSRRLV
ncbi:MAG: hypothetical protein ACXV8Q_09715 [Methylobacter sp.]